MLQSLSQELQDALLTQVCKSYCREQNPTDARKEELERIHKALTSVGHGHSFLLNEKSELGKFVSNIEEDAQPLNKFLAQVQNIQGSKLQDKINIDWIMKNTELPTLRKLYQVAEKLSFEKEASPLKKIGIVLACLTVLPGIIYGIYKLSKSDKEKEDLKKVATQVSKVASELKPAIKQLEQEIPWTQKINSEVHPVHKSIGHFTQALAQVKQSLSRER